MFTPTKDFSFNYTLDAVIGIDENSRIVEWNYRAQEYFGWSREEVFQKDVTELIIPHRFREAHRKGLKTYLKTGKGSFINQRVEVTALRRDGSEFEIELTVTPLEWQGKKLFYSHLRDISAQKKTAQRLATHNKVMSILVEGSSEFEVTPKILESITVGLGFDLGIFWSFRPGETKLSARDVYSKISHFFETDYYRDIKKRTFERGEGIPGRAWQQRKPFWISNFKEEGGFPRVSFAEALDFRSGSWFPVISKNSLYGVFEFMSQRFQKIDDEIIFTFVGLGQQIGQFMEKQASLIQTREAERNLRLITDAVPALISYVDKSGTYLFANKTFEEWLGRPLSEILGKKIGVLNPEDQDKARAIFQQILTGESFSYDMEIHHVQKGKRFIKAYYTPDILPDGSVQGCVILAQDVTDLENARKEAQIADKAKTEFLANMSHEIRTPLGAILGFSELMADTTQSPSDRLRWNSKIKANGEHLLKIINDILDLSKIESGTVELETESIPLITTFQEVLGTFEPHSREKGIELRFTTQGKIPEFIETDPVKFKQILINIIGNAIKFTQHGGVEVEVSFDEAASLLNVLVKDSGSGLTPEQAGRLFKPFSQGDSSVTRKFEGSGLGLVLARSFAKKLGGNVTLKSSVPNKGTEFLISVMVKAAPKTPSEQLAQKAPSPGILSGVKVLVVDDLSDNQLLTSLFLKRAGADVDVASSGQEAIDKALAQNFDVVLMDVQMPELDGHEAARRLRQQGFKPPIVALTAHAMKEDVQKSLSVGCNAHVTKPIVAEKLISTIDRLVRH